ncbi:ABC transporter substrate-binding protein [Oribacterium parvum]|nr:ABC transporter substrate-binding protein [Oribacterium parvum]
MNIEYYEKTIQKIYEAITVIEGLKDLKEGNTEEGAETMCKLKEKFLLK